MTNSDRLDLHANREALVVVAEWIADVCRRRNLTDTVAGQLNLILEELVSNLVEHAKPSGETPILVKIEMTTTDDFVTLRVSDEGAPFDPRTLGDPDLSADLEGRSVGGLGLYFVRELSDEFEYAYEDGWNVFRLRKRMKYLGNG